MVLFSVEPFCQMDVFTMEIFESLTELSASASKNAVEGLFPGGILTGEVFREFFTVAFNVEKKSY